MEEGRVGCFFLDQNIKLQKSMEGKSMEGPLRGLLFCKLPPNTTVGVTGIKDFLLQQPFGKESKELQISEESSYVFVKLQGM